MTTTHDLHVVDTRPLIPPALLHRDLPIDPTALETVVTARSRIQAILSGLDRRLLVIVGPCSVHDVDAARDYARRLGAFAGATCRRAGDCDAGVFRKTPYHRGMEGVD